MHLKAKHNRNRQEHWRDIYDREERQAMGCFQVLGVLAVALMAFLLFYEPIINLLR